jgi:hypothetical protein
MRARVGTTPNPDPVAAGRALREMASGTFKHCRKCDQDKPLAEFYKDQGRRCIACVDEEANPPRGLIS